MALHLFNKEWLKTKWFVLASLVLGVGTILYAFIGLNSNIINADGGSNYVFEWFTQAGQPHYGIFKNIPFIIALLIGGSQYLPEVLQKRIKLTLHLPLNEIVMLYTMVLYGFLMILSLMVIFMILFFTIDLYFFPVEMHVMAINAFLPWILGGFTTYFFVAMIAMEPSWKFRCLYAIVVYELLDIYLLGGNMSNLYVLMIIVLVIASLGMIYTANRFKIGEK